MPGGSSLVRKDSVSLARVNRSSVIQSASTFIHSYFLYDVAVMLLRLLQDQCFDTFLLYLLTRKLHCTRNYIHMNLFVSFILRAMAVILKEIMLYLMYSNLPKDDPGWKSYSSSVVQTKWFLSSSNVYSNSSVFNPPKVFWRLNCDVFPQIVLMCKVSQVFMEYFVICNCFWLLVEAVFLHTLLFTAVLTKRRLLKRSMLLGWGKARKSVKLVPHITVHGRH